MSLVSLWVAVDSESCQQFKTMVKDALSTLAVRLTENTSVRDLDSDQRTCLNEVLETVGLDPITYSYKVRATVDLSSIEIELDVEAASEEEAQEKVENDEFDSDIMDLVGEVVSNQDYSVSAITVDDVQETNY